MIKNTFPPKETGLKVRGQLNNYYVYANQTIKVGDFVIFTTGASVAGQTETQVKLATTYPFDGIAQTSGQGGNSTQHKDQIIILVPGGVS